MSKPKNQLQYIIYWQKQIKVKIRLGKSIKTIKLIFNKVMEIGLM